MKNVTITVTDCPMWKMLDLGTVLRMPTVHADKAISSDWATEAKNDKLLMGEKVKQRRDK